MTSEAVAPPKPLGLPERVIEFLVREGASRARPIRSTPLEGDASDRKYTRLTLEGSGEDGRSYVLMELSSRWVPQGSQRELPFVDIARHLLEKRIPVPRVFVDASDEGFVLLEDVGCVTLEAHLRRESLSEQRSRYGYAIETLVRMQAEGSRASSRPCHALTYSFDTQTFFRELCFFREHALEGLCGQSLAAEVRTDLDAHFWLLCEEISGYPKVFTHRDYHSRNLMVQTDRLVLLDFQDARLGPITYDLASLLRDSYVRLDAGEQEAGIARYRDLARQAGLPCPDSEAFRRAFSRTALQRNLKAIGTFAYQAVVKRVDRYLPYIPNTVGSVLYALEQDRELRAFRRLLGPCMERLSLPFERCI